MTQWMQNVIVILAVLACGGYIAWQVYRTLIAQRGGFGSCCAKGCAAMRRPTQNQKIIFLPVESLRKK